jgi:hypothetical protein
MQFVAMAALVHCFEATRHTHRTGLLAFLFQGADEEEESESESESEVNLEDEKEEEQEGARLIRNEGAEVGAQAAVGSQARAVLAMEEPAALELAAARGVNGPGVGYERVVAEGGHSGFGSEGRSGGASGSGSRGMNGSQAGVAEMEEGYREGIARGASGGGDTGSAGSSSGELRVVVRLAAHGGSDSVELDEHAARGGGSIYQLKGAREGRGVPSTHSLLSTGHHGIHQLQAHSDHHQHYHGLSASGVLHLMACECKEAVQPTLMWAYLKLGIPGATVCIS